MTETASATHRHDVDVTTGTPYRVAIGDGLLDEAGALLDGLRQGQRVAVVADATVEALYGDRLRASLERVGVAAASFSFPAGEASKTLATYADILAFLAQEHFTRSDVVIALGGGVTGDLTGFAAATFLRGVRFVQVPTTLLAMVDSSVGGKTGVDLAPWGKNLVGAFHQPSLVVCDPTLTATLPETTFADGVAEALKTGVLGDEALFARMEAPGWRASCLGEVIGGCVAIKAGVVSRDERERGERALLNLGHTVGHAIEAVTDYAVSHGHAVAMGMAVVARAAVAAGMATTATRDRLLAALRLNGLPTEPPRPLADILPAIVSDKKRAGDRLTLVVPETIGHCRLLPLPLSEAMAFLARGEEARP